MSTTLATTVQAGRPPRPVDAVTAAADLPAAEPSDFFEDIVVGTRIELGAHTFTRDEIVQFACNYDPQPFHMDEVAAAGSSLRRLSASGWHTAAVWMRLYVRHRDTIRTTLLARGERPAAPGPSPGFRDMRWRTPVHPGDTITYRSVVSGKRSLPKRDWGLVFHHNTGENQHGRIAVEFKGSVLWQCRSGASGHGLPDATVA